MSLSRIAVVSTSVLLAVGLTACSSGSAAPAASDAPPQSQAPASAGLDAKGLVAAMWAQLGESSQKQLCDIFASRGAAAGDVFVAGAESDPKAELLTVDDKAKIAAEAARLLEASCPGKA